MDFILIAILGNENIEKIRLLRSTKVPDRYGDRSGESCKGIHLLLHNRCSMRRAPGWKKRHFIYLNYQHLLEVGFQESLILRMQIHPFHT